MVCRGRTNRLFRCTVTVRVHTYLAGEVEEEDATEVGGMRMRAYADKEFCVLTVMAFINAAQYGIDHSTKPDRRLRNPQHGGMLVGLPPPMHRGVQKFELEAYFRPLTDELV